MKTTDLFKINRSSRRLNESMEKLFGQKINLESFDLPRLEDARNKLRTQLSQQRGESGFNENLENEAYTKAQFMLDAINAEIAQRQEFIADASTAEVSEEGDDADAELRRIVSAGDFDGLYELMTSNSPAGQKVQDMYNDISIDHRLHPDDNFEEILEIVMDRLEDEYGTGETDESVAMEKAPPGGKYERMVKHIKKGYAKDGKLTDKEKSIAYATAWKAKNKANESIEPGDNMTKLNEGEIQQAQSIVSAKTMVDRVGRWIEELSGMENDTLLQLGDQIRDEMSAELAKQYISSVAPAIQQALEGLKSTRETLASGVRMLTGEEQGAEMLGAEPGAEAGGEEELGAEFGGEAEPDMMNLGGEEEMGPPEDEFGASEAGAGGLEAAGRAKRESIEYSNKLLKVLAG